MDQDRHEISLEALLAGDQAEYSRMVDAFSGPIYRMAVNMLADKVDAEDVLQNTFLKAFQHLKEFEGRSHLSTWLYRIAANEALMMIRKRRPDVDQLDLRDQDRDDHNYTPAQLTDWCCLPEQDLLSTESRAALDQAVQHLPEILRIVFILRDIQGLSIQETSQVLNLTRSAVKTRLLRARLRLREDLSGYFGPQVTGKEQKGAKYD
jgi:RNA polymerase sigma-70 factor (ECF subfamily)